MVRIKRILFILLITFFFVEVSLRLLGFPPSKIAYNPWFNEVENLFLLEGFTTDDDGITKVDNNVFYNIDQKSEKYKQDSLVAEVYMVKEDHEVLINNDIENSLSRLYKQIIAKKTLNSFDNLVVQYVKCPINQDGFYSIPFKSHQTNKIKVLLLGDSFLFGHSAKNFTSSFANELLAKGYYVYNTGISGADVTQYKAIAEKYIPIIKPDIVFLNFFLGNDWSYYKRELKPRVPLFFSTNAGNLLSFQYGNQVSTKEKAYQTIKEASYLPKNNFFSKTTTSTFLWMVLRKFKIVNNESFIKHKKELEIPYCNIEIEEIKSMCKKHNALFKLIVISDYYNNKTNVDDFNHLLEGIDYNYSPVKVNGYNMNDGHFNVLGHYEYAIFLDSIISNENR